MIAALVCGADEISSRASATDRVPTYGEWRLATCRRHAGASGTGIPREAAGRFCRPLHRARTIDLRYVVCNQRQTKAFCS